MAELSSSFPSFVLHFASFFFIWLPLSFLLQLKIAFILKFEFPSWLFIYLLFSLLAIPSVAHTHILIRPQGKIKIACCLLLG